MRAVTHSAAEPPRSTRQRACRTVLRVGARSAEARHRARSTSAHGERRCSSVWSHTCTIDHQSSRGGCTRLRCMQHDAGTCFQRTFVHVAADAADAAADSSHSCVVILTPPDMYSTFAIDGPSRKRVRSCTRRALCARFGGDSLRDGRAKDELVRGEADGRGGDGSRLQACMGHQGTSGSEPGG